MIYKYLLKIATDYFSLLQEVLMNLLIHAFFFLSTVKPVLNDHSQKHQKLVFKPNYHLMQVKSIAECSKGSILQYFRPSLSYHLSLRSLFCLFLSGHLRQVLLYKKIERIKMAFSVAKKYFLFILSSF